jgi:Spy/CpxP family protein refolding chaperone
VLFWLKHLVTNFLVFEIIMQPVPNTMQPSGNRPGQSIIFNGDIMNKHTFLGSAVLVLGLLASGASFAENSDSSNTEPKTSVGKEVRAKIANMTPEERKAFFADRKAKWESLTPEQREAFKEAIRSPIAGMSKEEREAFRAEMKEKFDKMTPEQKAKVKEHMEHRSEHREHRAERMEHRPEHPRK